jgi:FkbM family methyltransferase
MLRIFADFVIKKSLKLDSVSSIVLRNLELQKVREFLGKDFLSPVQQFALDGYNSLLYQDLDIDKSGVVVVLGGYIGDSASHYSKNLGCHIHIYEPIDQFYRLLLSRFEGKKNIRIFNFAISSADGIILMNVEGEKTGQFNDSKTSVEVQAKDISGVIEKLGTVDLLESNIEGGEYSVLMKLIETGDISKIKVLQVQFHNFGALNEVDRSKIRFELYKTHKLIFSYEWVWERWELLGCVD